jgi:hypothetical protein
MSMTHSCSGLMAQTDRLHNFPNHLNSLRPTIQFTMEIESNNAIPFLDVLVIRKETTLATRVYRKLIHTGQYLRFKSNHPPHVKRSLIQSLHKRASTMCQERRDLCNEISTLRCDLQLSGYPRSFDSVINSKGSSHLNKEEKPLCYLYIPYVKGVLEKFKCIANRYNIKTIFKTKHTLRSSLMKTRLKRDQQQTAHCVYSILCECGRSYIGETRRTLAVRLREQRHNLK